MTNLEMQNKVLELKELKAMADEVSAEVKKIEEELKAELDAQQVDEMQAGAFKVRYKTIVTTRFDSKAFKAENAELYDRYTKESTSKRFTVA